MAKNCTGWLIRKHRIAKGLTVDQLSSALGPQCPIRPEALRQIEICQRKVYDFQLAHLASVLGVRVGDFYIRRKKHKK